MPPYVTLSLDEVKQVARATVNTLKSLDLDSCLVGSMACSAYGMSRVPNVRSYITLPCQLRQHSFLHKDIDLVVLTNSRSSEEIKNLLVSTNSNFFLVPSKDRYATYKVLWYSLTSVRPSYYARACKVDILLPGIMNIPSIPTQSIIYRATLPLMPFLPLLLLKLQAWVDHGTSTKEYLKAKTWVDVRDLTELLNLNSTTDRGKLRGLSSLPDTFVRTAKSHVARYVEMYPQSASLWKEVGFEDLMLNSRHGTSGLLSPRIRIASGSYANSSDRFFRYGSGAGRPLKRW